MTVLSGEPFKLLNQRVDLVLQLALRTVLGCELLKQAFVVTTKFRHQLLGVLSYAQQLVNSDADLLDFAGLLFQLGQLLLCLG